MSVVPVGAGSTPGGTGTIAPPAGTTPAPGPTQQVTDPSEPATTPATTQPVATEEEEDGGWATWKWAVTGVGIGLGVLLLCILGYCCMKRKGAEVSAKPLTTTHADVVAAQRRSSSGPGTAPTAADVAPSQVEADWAYNQASPEEPPAPETTVPVPEGAAAQLPPIMATPEAPRPEPRTIKEFTPKPGPRAMRDTDAAELGAVLPPVANLSHAIEDALSEERRSREAHGAGVPISDRRLTPVDIETAPEKKVLSLPRYAAQPVGPVSLRMPIAELQDEGGYLDFTDVTPEFQEP
eukprot:3935000-Rhodomonas_salina.2